MPMEKEPGDVISGTYPCPVNPEGRKVSEEDKWLCSTYCVLMLSAGFNRLYVHLFESRSFHFPFTTLCIHFIENSKKMASHQRPFQSGKNTFARAFPIAAHALSSILHRHLKLLCLYPLICKSLFSLKFLKI